MDPAVLAGGPERFPWRICVFAEESVLEDSTTAQPIAWLPTVGRLRRDETDPQTFLLRDIGSGFVQKFAFIEDG